MPSFARLHGSCFPSVFAKGKWAAFAIVACMLVGSNRLLHNTAVLETRADDQVHPPHLNALEVQLPPPQASSTAHARAAADALKDSTKVSVFLVKEVGTPPNARVMLFVRSEGSGGTDVVSTLSQPGESGKTAALRALAAHAGVLPVPDLDFIVNAGTASGDHAVFVALIREARLLLKGRQPADGKWVSFKDAALADSLAEATVCQSPVDSIASGSRLSGYCAGVFKSLVQDCRPSTRFLWVTF